MKDKHREKTKKHSKKSHSEKNGKEKHHLSHNSENHHNTLKEHPVKEDRKQKNEKRLEDKSQNVSFPKSDRHHTSSEKYQKSTKGHSDESHKKSRKHNVPPDESYEELSRKKQRIESELQALDREEAAAKQKPEKHSHSHNSRHKEKRKEKPQIKIKEEPLSGDEGRSKHSNIREKPKLENKASEDRKPRPHSSRTSEEEHWGKTKEEKKEPIKEKDKPNFAVSGKLAEDTNTYNGVVIKYNEPTEARKPKRRWRLYPFKGTSDLPFIPIHRQSAYLFGRTRTIADIPIDHPSCSKQHAVLQFRLVSYKRENGTTGRRVRPYIIDLESSNGTYVNNNRIDARCYVELMERDVVKFGYSSREYVVLHEESKNAEEDDDIIESP